MTAEQIYVDFLAGRCAINFSCKKESETCISYLSSHTDLDWVGGTSLTEPPRGLFRGHYVMGIRMDLGINRLRYLDLDYYDPGDFDIEYTIFYAAIAGFFVDDLTYDEIGFLSLMGGVCS